MQLSSLAQMPNASVAQLSLKDGNLCLAPGGRPLTENDDRGRPVPNLLVLSAADLDHRLGRRMLNCDLQEKGEEDVGQTTD